MAPQTIQKCHRLLLVSTLGALSLLASCAKSLKQNSELHLDTPAEFQGVIETYHPQPAAPAPPPPLPVNHKTKKLKTPKPAPKAPPAVATLEGHVAPLPLSTPRWSPSEWPYGLGEKITWVLRYGPIEGGVASLSVEPLKLVNNEPAIHFRGVVKSSKLLEFFYKVDNEIQTWVRASDHLPIRQEIKQNESGRWGQRIVRFDSEKNLSAFYSHMTLKDGRIDEVKREDPITPFAQDIFGSLYFYRFAENIKRINFPIHDRWRNWNNEIVYLGEETIEVPAGKYETYHFKMFPRVSGALEPKGDVEMWLWKHPSKLVVQFKAKIKIGSLTGELKSYEAGTLIPLPPPQMRTPINLTELGEVPVAQTR